MSDDLQKIEAQLKGIDAILRGENGDPGFCEQVRNLIKKFDIFEEENKIEHTEILNKMLKKIEDVFALIKSAQPENFEDKLKRVDKILKQLRTVLITAASVVLSLGALIAIFHKQLFALFK